MNTSEPIGDPAWGAFFVRVAVGAFFVFKGLNELEHLPVAIQATGYLKHLPPHVLALLGFLIPYLEILFGSMLVAGFWTIIGAIGTSLIALFFVYASGISPLTIKLANKDFIVLAGALSLLYTGAGALSVDKFRKS